MTDQYKETPPTGEERTYREGVQRYSDANFTQIDKRFDAFKETLSEFVERAEDKAQMANDALQRLLQNNIDTMIKLTDQGLASTQAAIAHVEAKIGLIVNNTAEKVDNVDARADQRSSASTELLAARLVSLTEITELRAEINRMSIERTEKALERRIDNASNIENSSYYVTKPTFDARLDQFASETSSLQANISSLQAKFLVAAVGLVGIALIGEWVLFRVMH